MTPAVLHLTPLWQQVHAHLHRPTPALPPGPWDRSGWACGMVEVRLDGSRQADLMGAWIRDGRAVPAVPGAEALPEVVAALDDGDAGVPLVWVEWDHPDSPVAPLWSIALSDRLVGAMARHRPPVHAETRRPWIRRALHALWEGPGPQAATVALDRTLDSLEHDVGELLHMASLAPRGAQGVRLTWQVRADHLAKWLHHAGWPGDLDAVRALVATLSPACSHLGVQTELRPDFGPYLGVELPEARRGAPARERLAHRLEGLPGTIRRHPQDVAHLVAWTGPRPSGDGLRHAYAKLVLAPGGWSVKGYLGATPTPVDRALRRASRAAMAHER